jgi:DNA-binding NtrC family response regulator
MTAPTPQAPLILLVEPDRLQRDLIALAVQRGQMSCKPARCIQEVRQVITNSTPDLALIDLHLKGENSLDLVKALKGSRRFNELKVIVFSSYGFPEVIHQAVEAGACDFLVKPLEMDMLLGRIRQALGQQSPSIDRL